MQKISKKIALEFCHLCEWAYEIWMTHRTLFDDNESTERNIGKLKYFTRRLSCITQEYCLHQIAKLHDPATQGGSKNLTVNYMIQFGEWGERAREIESIEARLLELPNHIKLLRNKILSHNDLKTFRDNPVLGNFPDGIDEEYFAALQDLVNEVHNKWVGGSYPFKDYAQTDAHEFLTLLERS